MDEETTSTKIDEDIKRWTAKCKSALVVDIIQDKTTVVEASRTYDLSPSEVENWVDDGKRGIENALRANRLCVKEQYKRQIKELQEAYGEAMLELRARKNCCPCWERKGSDRNDPPGTEKRKRCRFDFQALQVVRRAAPNHALPASQGRTRRAGAFLGTDQGHDRESPSFGYRTVAYLLGFNKNTVQRVFQLMGWQVRKRPVGFRPRAQSMPSVALKPNSRWSTDMCRIWAGRDGWATLALVIDCYTCELLGWHLSRSGKAMTAASALKHASIARFGTLGRVLTPFLMRSDNGLVFTSRTYTKLVRDYGLKQEFITPHCPQQNGMVERVIRTLKEQCVHRQRFEALQHASRVIADWIQFYNHRRPHCHLKMKTPVEEFALAA